MMRGRCASGSILVRPAAHHVTSLDGHESGRLLVHGGAPFHERSRVRSWRKGTEVN
jgi:hypothetical protein